jgi:hypothetical protein
MSEENSRTVELPELQLLAVGLWSLALKPFFGLVYPTLTTSAKALLILRFFFVLESPRPWPEGQASTLRGYSIVRNGLA